MLKLIEKNYFKINMAFILIVAVYCMCGLIVPLQFISANKIVAGGMTLFGILLATYNLVIKKVYLKIKTIEYLLLFFAFNIITSMLVISYGYSTNIKNALIFYIYFLTVFPIFTGITREEGKKIYDYFFYTVTVLNTFGVLVSLIQFVLLKGYRVHDYKGLYIRQGFVESRLFGILASPNYLSLISLIVIIFLVLKVCSFEKVYRYISIVAIVLNFIYIVLSGSRTAFICMMIAAVIYSIVMFYQKGNVKSLLKVALAIVVVLFSYKAVNFTSEQYLKYNKERLEVQDKKLENKDNNLSLERTDTSEENISNNRFAIWKSTASFVPKKPIFGYSGGNWYEIGKKMNPDEYIIKEHYLTHNGYLEILFYNGLVGFISMGIFVLSFFISMVKRIFRDKKEDLVNKDLLSMIMILMVILVSNLFLSSTFYGISLLGIILFLMAGYFYSIVSTDKSNFKKLDIDEIKEVELGVMDYIHNICREKGINYSLAYGSLLGAVRHRGFIPWDDDLDIALKRDQYDKLYQAILEDNNSIYKVVSWENDSRYPYPFYRVYDSRTVYENNYIQNDIELGICVDVFPFDDYKDVNKEITKLDMYRRLSVYTLYGIRNKEAGIKNIVRYLMLVAFRLTRVKTWNKKLNDCSKVPVNSEYIDYLMESKKYSTKIDAKALDKVIGFKFEDRVYNIPTDYDHILTTIYGADYMEIPPIEKRIQHDDFVAYIKKEN
ncbi:LicD family protein [Gemella sp. 20925_1_85]|uniref:LicD family protein n=1 Tax=Gemella sp. 20925_1_85 TaxID=3003690 RepID=UPI00352FE5CB